MAKHPGHINQRSILCGKVGFSSYYSQVKTERFISFSISVLLHLITSGGELPSFQFIQMQTAIESRRQWRILPEASSCCVLHAEACWKGFLKSERMLGVHLWSLCSCSRKQMQPLLWLGILAKFVPVYTFSKSNTLEQVGVLEGTVV